MLKVKDVGAFFGTALGIVGSATAIVNNWESAYAKLAKWLDSPTDISGSWQWKERNFPVAICRHGKAFSLDICPTDPRWPVLNGEGIKDWEPETFVFRGNEIDGTGVLLWLWLVDDRTLRGNKWKGDEVPGEDEGEELELVKRS